MTISFSQMSIVIIIPASINVSALSVQNILTDIISFLISVIKMIKIKQSFVFEPATEWDLFY